jgi:EPS-associated MarR family transcriptional regulator
MRLLDTRPNRSQREMAQELGMSLGKANYVLKALLEKGFVKAQNFKNSSNKRGYAYVLTPSGAAAKVEFAKRFLATKMQEYDELRAEIERLKQESNSPVNPD